MTDQNTSPEANTQLSLTSPGVTPATAKANTTARDALAAAAEPLPEDGAVLEADDGFDNDSAFGTDNSDSTSIASSIYAGYLENGRRYQTLREGEYWGPSDEKQWESMQAAHLVLQILDSKRENNLFHSPIKDAAPNILDIGTGDGMWCADVADRFPSAFVQGVDLFPPPNTWVPPNCKFEVDDVLKTWEFQQRFHLIHLRWLLGAFTDQHWTGIYKQAYQNLEPGGWIEQVEPRISWYSQSGTLPKDSLLANWGPMFARCSEKMGKKIDTADQMKLRLEAAGFINIQEKTYKTPVGEWAKGSLMKEAGKFQKAQMLAGMEGYAMYLFTKFGEPEPWQPAEVQVYLAKVRQEIETPGFNLWTVMKRVWAQKPLAK